MSDHSMLRAVAPGAIALLMTLSMGAQAATSNVGTAQGQFAVDASGAATYTIPLIVPPGIGGTQPELSLVYSSQQGNGPLGVGWSLGGLSAITRCPTTLAQDGFIDGVDFDSNDRFCLDGQRLVAVSGAYGAEYRTEKESYVKIVPYGAVGTGPASFKAQTKSGLIMEYGTTADSVVMNQSGTDNVTWMLARVLDTNGNSIAYNYFSDPNAREHRLLRKITYGGNQGGVAANLAELSLSYESRPDEMTRYGAGTATLLRARLAKISKAVNGSAAGEYRISYRTSSETGSSQIAAITECSADLQCKPSTDFAWTNSEVHLGELDLGLWGAPSQDPRIFPGDYNGDGLGDILYLLDTGKGYNWRLRLSNGTEFGDVSLGLWGWPSQNQEIFVGDYNGDGRSDILYLLDTGNGYNWRLRLSNGTGFGDASLGVWGRPSQNPEIFVGDYNGDGRSDILYLLDTGNGYDWRLRLSNGAGFGDVSLGVWGRPSQNPEIFVGDYNGDGRSDILYLLDTGNGYDWRLRLSSGTGFGDVSLGLWGRPSRNPQFFVGDYNGDRITDLLCLLDTGNGYDWRLRISTGSSFGDKSLGVWGLPSQNPQIFAGDYNADGRSDILYLLDTGDGYDWRLRLYDGTSFGEISLGVWGTPQQEPRIFIGNYNGDLRTDVLYLLPDWRTSDFSWRLRLFGQGTTAPDQVASITNGLGDSIAIEYRPLTDPFVYSKHNGALYPTLDVQSPISVVSQYSRSDGLGGKSTYKYKYEGAKADLRGRGFLGFRAASVRDEQTGITTTTTYRQDFPYTGGVEQTETRLANGRLTTLSTASSVMLRSAQGIYSLLSSTSSEENYELDGTLVSTTTIANENYDAYGNVGKVTVTTTAGGQTYSKITDNVYDNDPSRWHLGRLTRATVTAITPTGTASRTSAFEYDPTSGLLTAEIVEPDDPELMLRTAYQHDAYGNKTAVTVSDSGAATYGIVSSTSTTTYDYSRLGIDGTYTTTASNAKGHSETRVIDARFGVTKSLTGPNGLTTHWQYDGFGRQIREVRSDGTETNVSYAWCETTTDCPDHARYQVTTLSSGTAPRTVYYDRLNRELRTRSVGFGGEDVFKDTRYNSLGQLWKVSRPYFAASATPSWTEYGYDALGRVQSETSPDSGVVDTTYSGLSTTVRRYSGNAYAYDQSVTRIKNAQGEVREVIDEDANHTTYVYDPFGNLTTVTDAAGNVSTMAYDRRGRKTGMDDPDMGQWEYAYDALGQLRRQRDAKGQITTSEYDTLGRLIRRSEAEGTSTWTYDTAPAGTGKLASVTGPYGYARTLSYLTSGAHTGRLQSTTTRLPNSLTGTGTDALTEALGYDAYGRVLTRSYPSGFSVRHVYTENGYLAEVRNGTDNARYWQVNYRDAAGQLEMETLGNELVSTRTYDPLSGRVQNIVTGDTGEVQYLNYRFDAQGNLRERRDEMRVLSESFEYDSLNRLVSASIAGGASRTYQYDALGNIEYKSDVGTYSYGQNGAGPHAVTTAGGVSYAYDANGNQLSGDGRTLTYTSFNKPKRVLKGATAHDYRYDAEHERVLKVAVQDGQTTRTQYLGKGYERVVKPSGVIEHRHYIATGTTTVLHTTRSNGTIATRYLHTDHLGSTDVITDEHGKVVEQLSFDAWGARRLSDWSPAAGFGVGIISSVTRGFTGHEHDDGVGLINMNARLYDPKLGRFLQARILTCSFPIRARGSIGTPTSTTIRCHLPIRAGIS